MLPYYFMNCLFSWIFRFKSAPLPLVQGIVFRKDCAIVTEYPIIVINLAVIALYIGKMNFEVKGRPQYIIDKVLDDEKDTL